MTNRNLLLGRSKPSEKLTRAAISALENMTVPSAPPTRPAKPPGKKGGGQRRWSARTCSSSAGASTAPLRVQGHRPRANPSPGSVWPGAAAASWSSS